MGQHYTRIITSPENILRAKKIPFVGLHLLTLVILNIPQDQQVHGIRVLYLSWAYIMAYFHCSFIIYVEVHPFVKDVGFSKCLRIYSERDFQVGYANGAEVILSSLYGIQTPLRTAHRPAPYCRKYADSSLRVLTAAQGQVEHSATFVTKWKAVTNWKS